MTAKLNSYKHIVKQLSEPDSYKKVFYLSKRGKPMPNYGKMQEIVELLRQIIFPGYFGDANVSPENMEYYIGVNLDKMQQLLSEQIIRGLCFNCHPDQDFDLCPSCDDKAEFIVEEFLKTLPEIRNLLATDVQATYNGDPASKSYGEIIYCYPGIRAITNYRIAHQLHKLNLPLIPRIITEMAHFETGIDIHPGANIDSFFAIDHGTGVVIGETTIIGKNVKIYQGVTLGAKSFPLDENGNPIKGISRHPIVEDNVVIYAEATILGRVTIGKNSTIGGNMWITHDIAPNSKLSRQYDK